MAKKKKKIIQKPKVTQTRVSNFPWTSALEADSHLSMVLAEQRRGNQACKSGQYYSALFHYTYAISLVPLSKQATPLPPPSTSHPHQSLANTIVRLFVSLLLNRAVTCMRLRFVESVISDAKYALFLDPLSFKAHLLLFFAYKHVYRLKASHFHLLAAIELYSSSSSSSTSTTATPSNSSSFNISSSSFSSSSSSLSVPVPSVLKRFQDLICSMIKKYNPLSFASSSDLFFSPADPFRPGCPIEGADEIGFFDVEGTTSPPTDNQLLYNCGDPYPPKRAARSPSPFCICSITVSCDTCLVCNDSCMLTLSPIFYPPSFLSSFLAANQPPQHQFIHPQQQQQQQQQQQTLQQHPFTQPHQSPPPPFDEPTVLIDDDHPPPLIPVGECLTLHAYHADYLPEQFMSLSASLTKAQSEKAAGNDAFMKGTAFYHQALFHYSRAIQLYPTDPIFYSNRALVYLKLERFHECISDCTTALSFSKSIKVFHRRAVAWMSLGEFQRAICDYKRALAIEHNASCAVELDRALMLLVQQRQELLDLQLARLSDPKSKSKNKPILFNPIEHYYIESLKLLLREVQTEQESRRKLKPTIKK